MSEQNYPNGRAASASGRSTEFLSRGCEVLLAELESGALDAQPFDVIIIGSGYGGAMVAAELSKAISIPAKRLKIGVLERGSERLPGMFPDKLSELPTEVRVYRNDITDDNGSIPQVLGNRKGLFDIRVGDGCSALVANGLGGGSLINAGVMLEPDTAVFQSPAWPSAIRNDSELSDLFQQSKVLVGSSLEPGDGRVAENTISNSGRSYEKFDSLRELAKGKMDIKAVPITVKLDPDDPNQAVVTDNCISCGDCFSGCNYNAKKSLDTNLLATAAINGVEIYCGVSVLSFDKAGESGWELEILPTDEQLKKRVNKKLVVRCAKLVVAAGTFGSTELLLRSEASSVNGLKFSDRLGERFSGNGDMLVTISDRTERVNSVASEKKAAGLRNVGPTITGMIDLRESAEKTVIQELSVPAILHGFLAESTSLSQTIGALTRPDKAKEPYSDAFCSLSPAGPLGEQDKANHRKYSGAMDGSETDYISALALMGDDARSGRIFLPRFDFQNTNTSRNKAAPDGVGNGQAANGNPYKDTPVEGIVNFELQQSVQQAATPGGSLGFLDKLRDFIGFKSDRQVADFYERNTRLIDELVKQNDERAWPHANPLWRPLGSSLSRLFNFSLPGMVVTVHPLGGCCMADSAVTGVVDHYGRVFDGSAGDPEKIHDGLVVLDGSILPTPTGINPALTITTLALRSSRYLRSQWWQYREGKQAHKAAESQVRPVFNRLEPFEQKPKKATSLELVERLVGDIPLLLDGVETPCVVELRLRSEPFDATKYTRFVKRDIPLLAQISKDPAGLLPENSLIRIFRKDEWDRHHRIADILRDREIRGEKWITDKRVLVVDYLKRLDKYALVIATVTGKITLLEELPANRYVRMARGFCAWFINRGARDMFQSAGSSDKSMLRSVWDSFRTFFNANTFAVFSHTGRERRMYYDLKVGQTLALDSGNIYTSDSSCARLIDISHCTIKGYKQFQYKVSSNPWRQLMDIHIEEFPLMYKSALPKLSVDPEYFALTKAPLLHIHDEENAVDGYGDLFAFYAQAFRVFLLQHLWTLRKPDTEKQSVSPATQIQKEPGVAENRLPPELPGLERTVYPLAVRDVNGHLASRPVVQARLTRYKSDAQSAEPPVLCIHGYSASGTTFAHNALYGGRDSGGGLTAYLAQSGREVWVLDMRCSAGMPGRTTPWRFEDMAYKDIPTAVSQICEASGSDVVDVVAHCMGAVMLSIALLGEPKSHSTISPLTSEEKKIHKRLHGQIRKVVLSQAGPYLRFTDANTLRSFVLSYVRRLLPEAGFEFNPGNPDDNVEVLIDRFLNTLPYPDNSEFKIENPFIGNRYWVRARHRMDALYGRTFNLKNMSDVVLNSIDDFFGPVNFRTLEQTLWISNRKQVSDREGGEYYFSSNELNRWTYPTLWVHAEENGLIDPRSPSLTALVCDEKKVSNFKFAVIKGVGHQDCLIGKDCEKQFREIKNHLSAFPA